MAGTFTTARCRIKVDNITNRFGPLVDALKNNAQPAFYQAEDINFELGAYSNGVILADKTNITDVVMEVKDPENLLGSPLISKTVLAAAMDATISDADWITNSAAKVNATFTLSKADTNIELDGRPSRLLQLFFWIDTNDGTSKRLLLGQSPITIYDSGYGDIGAITVTTPGARIKANKLQIKNQDDGLYYDAVYRNVSGVPVLSIEGNGVA